MPSRKPSVAASSLFLTPLCEAHHCLCLFPLYKMTGPISGLSESFWGWHHISKNEQPFKIPPALIISGRSNLPPPLRNMAVYMLCTCCAKAVRRKHAPASPRRGSWRKTDQSAGTLLVSRRQGQRGKGGQRIYTWGWILYSQGHQCVLTELSGSFL